MTIIKTREALFPALMGASSRMRNAIRTSALLIAAAGCSDTTAPRLKAAAVEVIYSDSAFRAAVVRTGHAPAPVPALDNTELFAPLSDGMVTYNGSGFSVFHFATPELTPFEDRVERGAFVSSGAVSRNGRRLAYASGLDFERFLHTVDLTTGIRDSVDVTAYVEPTIADQMLFSVPVWSPSGDSVAFLLPNVIGIQIMIHELGSQRVEVKPMSVATSTFFRVLGGRPHWSTDGTIRMLTRRTEVEPNRLLDTLVVLRVFPREAMPHAEVVSRAVAPDSMTMGSVWSYSFSADGRTGALGMSSAGRAAIMVMQEGVPTLETLLYGTGLKPRDIILIP